MDIQKLVAIGLKIFSIVLFLKAWQQSTYLFELFMTGGISGMSASPVSLVTVALILLIFALLLWLFPLSFSKLIVKPELNTEIEKASSSSLLLVVVVGLGLYIISYAASDLAYYVTMMNISSASASESGIQYGINPETKSLFIITIFELAVGLFLVLKGRSVTAFLSRVAN